MDYQPQPPADTAELPPEISALTEQLARHVHDVWAHQRISDGWTYGGERNDNLKKHPCLVAYEDLPESEKKYDRQNVMQMLRALLALGYRISKS